MEPSLFKQVDEEYGPFDNDAFSDQRTAQLNGEGEKDFYQTQLAAKHSYVNRPYDSRSMSNMMQYYQDQKDTDPFNTSAVFIVPLWEQKKWFQQHFAKCRWSRCCTQDNTLSCYHLSDWVNPQITWWM
jgi:hypothetical protein